MQDVKQSLLELCSEVVKLYNIRHGWHKYIIAFTTLLNVLRAYAPPIYLFDVVRQIVSYGIPGIKQGIGYYFYDALSKKTEINVAANYIFNATNRFAKPRMPPSSAHQIMNNLQHIRSNISVPQVSETSTYPNMNNPQTIPHNMPSLRPQPKPIQHTRICEQSSSVPNTVNDISQLRQILETHKVNPVKMQKPQKLQVKKPKSRTIRSYTDKTQAWKEVDWKELTGSKKRVQVVSLALSTKYGKPQLSNTDVDIRIQNTL
eukprot:855291_1